jgi:ArsR family transcriptional regulator, virulence genes transcriptional regulator
MTLDPRHMAAAADEASELLRSLGNRHRLLILCQLTEGERSVGDLAGFLELRDSTVSQHLSLLRRDGLVRARRDGQTIWYSITSPPARRVLEALFDIFCKPASLCERPARQRKHRASPRVAGSKR